MLHSWKYQMNEKYPNAIIMFKTLDRFVYVIIYNSYVIWVKHLHIIFLTFSSYFFFDLFITH